MAHSPYDPQKAHDYYEKTKQLKGRHPATAVVSPNSKTLSLPPTNKSHLSPKVEKERAIARVGRLKVKVTKLEGALSEAEKALSEKRQKAAETKKQNSDGKTTVAERLAAKESRDKHQTENAAKTKQDSTKSGSSGSSSSTSKSTDVSSMSVEELSQRVSKIQSVLKVARQQLSNAQQALGSLSHSDLLASGVLSMGMDSIPTLAERNPSK